MLNLSPIRDQVFRVHNMLQTWNCVRNNDLKVESDISQMSAFIKIYAMYHGII